MSNVDVFYIIFWTLLVVCLLSTHEIKKDIKKRKRRISKKCTCRNCTSYLDQRDSEACKEDE